MAYVVVALVVVAVAAFVYAGASMWREGDTPRERTKTRPGDGPGEERRKSA
jgi:hypothetical protein